MAQTKGLVNLLKVKMANITSQRDRLYGVMDSYVQRVTSKAKKSLETDLHDVDKLKEISTALDTVLENLLEITSHMEDEAVEPLSTDTDHCPDTTATSTRKLNDTEPDQVSKLLHRMDVLDLAVSMCRNEVDQVNKDKNEVTDKLGKLEDQMKKVETSNSHHEKKLASLEKITRQTQSNMTREIKDLVRETFKANTPLGKSELIIIP